MKQNLIKALLTSFFSLFSITNVFIQMYQLLLLKVIIIDTKYLLHLYLVSIFVIKCKNLGYDR